MDVEEEVLEDGSKMSKGVNCQRKQDHVLVKDAANDCVADGGDARCWVGFFRPSFFFFSFRIFVDVNQHWPLRFWEHR